MAMPNSGRASTRWSLPAYCAAMALTVVGGFQHCWEAQSAAPGCDSDRVVQNGEVEETTMQSIHSMTVLTAQDGCRRRGYKRLADFRHEVGVWENRSFPLRQPPELQFKI